MAAEGSLEASARLEDELGLLKEMYPHHITFDSKSRDFSYTSPNSPNANLVLRLPDKYPVTEDEPQIILARDKSKNDVRDKVRKAFDVLGVYGANMEILDILIERFEAVTADTMQVGLAAVIDGKEYGFHHKSVEFDLRSKLQPRTVIIWLHHLLATNKRKLAVSLSLNTTILVGDQFTPLEISGVTKPGYPGIMIFSGRSDLVDAHVRELKGLNWQAFQIRYDSADGDGKNQKVATQWEFSCCRGKIVEVETMAQIVQNIVDEENKQIFLKAVGVK